MTVKFEIKHENHVLEQVSKGVYRLKFKIKKPTGEDYFRTIPEYDNPKPDYAIVSTAETK